MSKTNSNKHSNERSTTEVQKNRNRKARRQPAKDRLNEKFNQISQSVTTNDPDWYFTSKELAEQTANFPFPYFLGHYPTVSTFDVPTVMIAKVNPSPGISGTSAPAWGGPSNGIGGANMAAQKLYTRLSVASGRTAAYQASDVLLSLLATTEVVTLIEYARRFFGVAMTYNQRNRVFAIKILTMLAGGLAIEPTADPDTSKFGEDFVTHLADYRLALNSLITKVNQIPILADIGYVRKSIALYQQLYLDDMTDTAQIYAMVPQSTWKLDEIPATEEQPRGSQLLTVPVAGSIATFQDLLAIIDDCIKPLLDSTTLNYVYADIYNYQARYSMNFFKLDYVVEGYSVIPIYSERFLSQIHNASAIDLPMARATWNGSTLTDEQRLTSTPENDVRSLSNGLILYNPLFHGNSNASWMSEETKLLFDFPTSAPTLEDKIDNIMFKCGMPTEKYSGTGTISHAWCAGAPIPDHYITEFIVYGSELNTFFRFANANTAGSMDFGKQHIALFGISGLGASLTRAHIASLIQAFNMAPGIVMYPNETVQDSRYHASEWDGQKTYMTEIDNRHFRLMLDLAYQGLFELRQ